METKITILYQLERILIIRILRIHLKINLSPNSKNKNSLKRKQHLYDAVINTEHRI